MFEKAAWFNPWWPFMMCPCRSITPFIIFFEHHHQSISRSLAHVIGHYNWNLKCLYSVLLMVCGHLVTLWHHSCVLVSTHQLRCLPKTIERNTLNFSKFIIIAQCIVVIFRRIFDKDFWQWKIVRFNPAQPQLKWTDISVVLLPSLRTSKPHCQHDGGSPSRISLSKVVPLHTYL